MTRELELMELQNKLKVLYIYTNLQKKSLGPIKHMQMRSLLGIISYFAPAYIREMFEATFVN
jgi:hypothetical protein